MLPPKSPNITTYLLTAMQTTHTYTFPWDQKKPSFCFRLSEWFQLLDGTVEFLQLNNSKPENYCSLPQTKALVLWSAKTCQATVLHLSCSLMQPEGACHPVGRAEQSWEMADGLWHVCDNELAFNLILMPTLAHHGHEQRSILRLAETTIINYNLLLFFQYVF